MRMLRYRSGMAAAIALSTLPLLAGAPARAADPAPPAPAPASPMQTCAGLVSLDLAAIGGAGSRVTGAEEATAGGNPVCSVRGTLAPSIGFQVLLPLQGWTGRYMQLGCGGLCGNITLRVGAADGCATVSENGFALAATDMGHQGRGGEFGEDPQRRTDFAYRAQHLTSRAAKALIAAFYGRPPAFSYFNGCSDGGREALVEAQRFPDDFDGIIAGAPAMNFQVQNSLYHAWQAVSNTGPEGKAILLAGRLPILHDAVLKACDALDGQVDGLLAAPQLCRFDPASIRCPDGQAGATCLSAAEAEVARRFYEGPRDPVTGTRLTLGGPFPGSELAWAGVYVPRAADQPIMSRMIAQEAMQSLIFPNRPPAGSAATDLTFDLATFAQLRERHSLFDATNPDLSAFAARGGKLILWHGLADPHISPMNTIAYHQAVRALLGEDRAAAFERLYLMPGVHHCSGGEGPSLIDLVTPMMNWVERGQAPDGIVATQAPTDRATGFGLAGGPPRGGPGHPPRGEGPSAPGLQDLGPRVPDAAARSRPVLPYPFVAALRSGSDPDRASSYGQGEALGAVNVPEWAGTEFYRPYNAAR